MTQRSDDRIGVPPVYLRFGSPNFPAFAPRPIYRHTVCSEKEVSDGTRTRGRRDHNPELYQLSYAHQAAPSIAA